MSTISGLPLSQLPVLASASPTSTLVLVTDTTQPSPSASRSMTLSVAANTILGQPFAAITGLSSADLPITSPNNNVNIVNGTTITASFRPTGTFFTGPVLATGQITSTLAIGTAPFSVVSTTNVANLNASSLSGATFASPGPIGGTTASTGAFTTLSASGLVSGSGFSTYITNFLASPPAIGGTVAGGGTFNALTVTAGSATAQLNITGASGAAGSVLAMTSPSTASIQVNSSAASATVELFSPSTSGLGGALYFSRGGTIQSQISTLSVFGAPSTSNDLLIQAAAGNNIWFYINTSAVAEITSTGLAVTGTASVTGQLTSTLSTGTAPFIVASTTNVANLNASSLSGATFASPGAIGSGSASTGAFTTLTSSSTAVFTGNTTVGATGSGTTKSLTITGDQGTGFGPVLIFTDSTGSVGKIGDQPGVTGAGTARNLAIQAAVNMTFYTNGITSAFTLGTDQSASFSGVAIHKNYIVSTLPSAASYQYGIVFVSDSTSAPTTGIGTAPSGTGTNVRAVYSNGTSWLQM